MSLVIGEISYTNILPMFYYADRKRLQEAGCSFVPAIPAKLNKDMAAGKVDVGGISSFAYGEHFDEYFLLPDLSVSSQNEVGSIFLFSKCPIEELTGRSVALTSSSATSVNLLKIILQKFYNLEVSYDTVSPDYEKMMKNHDACLLIGDDAILASFNRQPNIYLYDLGALWSHFTSLPMTYALFAVRQDTIKRSSDLLQEAHAEFLKSKQMCKDDGFTEMITSIQYQMGGSSAFWHDYFAGLNFELTDKHIVGLHHFYDLAYELNLLHKKVSKIAVWNKSGHIHSV